MSQQGSVLLPASSTSFISKFCFTFNPPLPRLRSNDLELPGKSAWWDQEGVGILEVTVWVPTMMPGQYVELLLLDDEADSYPGPSSDWSNLTCQERTLRSKIWQKLHYSEVTNSSGQVLRFKIVEKVRPRWWFVALNDCTDASLVANYASIVAHFKVHAENSIYGWASEFSTDKRFHLFVFAPLALIYACLAAVQLRANCVLVGMESLDDASSKAAHPFARMLLAGIMLGLGATTLSTVHNAFYAYYGTAHSITQVIAQFLYVSSSFFLASLLLLVSQGKCISYIMVTADGWRMLRLLGPFLISCFLLEVWGDHSVSRRFSVDYVYTTPFGWTLIFVDLVLLGVYLTNLRKTYAVERDSGDGRFYRTWGIAYGVWFLALPVTAVLSQAILAPYIWCIVSLAVTKTATALAYAALVLGLWPGNTRTYFKLFMAKEHVMESCVTPPSRCAWDRLAASGCVSEEDRFGDACNIPQARLPMLLGAKHDLSVAMQFKK